MLSNWYLLTVLKQLTLAYTMVYLMKSFEESAIDICSNFIRKIGTNPYRSQIMELLRMTHLTGLL